MMAEEQTSYPTYKELIKQDRIELDLGLRLIADAPLDKKEPLTPGAIDRLRAAREWAWRQHKKGVFTITPPRRVRGRKCFVKPAPFLEAAAEDYPLLRDRLRIPLTAEITEKLHVSDKLRTVVLPSDLERSHQEIKTTDDKLHYVQEKLRRALQEKIELSAKAKAYDEGKARRRASARRQAQKRKNEEL